MNIVIYKVKMKSINLSQLRMFCKFYLLCYYAAINFSCYYAAI